MTSTRNSSGRSLSSTAWLEAHNRAKLPERTAFAEKLARLGPKSVVDLGCGPGLWLEVLSSALPRECALVGVDSDLEALEQASVRAKSWDRETRFVHCDITQEFERLPSAEMYLMFNMLPYLPDAGGLIQHMAESPNFRYLVVRQYDGSQLRFGPLEPSDRNELDRELFTSVGSSAEFQHYAMDQAYQEIQSSALNIKSMYFETTQRFAPFAPEFTEYLDGTVDWVRERVSTRSAAMLPSSLSTSETGYFLGVDLVAFLAAS